MLRTRIEERVLSGLEDRLVSVESVGQAVGAHAHEINRLNGERRTQVEADRKALDEIARHRWPHRGHRGRYVSAGHEGAARMEELERQKAESVARLVEAPADMPDVHLNIANVYRDRVVTFTQALNDPDGRREAAAALR